MNPEIDTQNQQNINQETVESSVANISGSPIPVNPDNSLQSSEPQFNNNVAIPDVINITTAPKVKYFRWWMILAIGAVMIVSSIVYSIFAASIGIFQLPTFFQTASMVLFFVFVFILSVYAIKGYQEKTNGISKPLWQIGLFVFLAMLWFVVAGFVALLILVMLAMNSYASNK